MIKIKKYLLVAVVSLLFSLLYSTISSAHEGRPVYIELFELDNNVYELSWKIPPVLSSEDLPVLRLRGEHCRKESEQLSNGLLGKKRYVCLSPSSQKSLVKDASQSELAVDIIYPFINPALSSLLVFTTHSGDVRQIYSSPEVTYIKVPGDSNYLSIAKQYILGGIEHILIGYDHLLFVFCLLGLIRSRRDLFLTISGFTLAHSVTLILASFNYISINILLIETLIALSITVLAAEVIKGLVFSQNHSLAWRYPIFASSILGLLHGFGFASVLADLGLPSDLKISALLFFNIGIEIGQLVFVICVVIISQVILRFFKESNRENTQKKILVSSTFIIGVVSAYWTLTRLNLIT